MTNSFYVSLFNPAPFDAHMRIVSHIKPGSRVLDIGCNTGELGEQLKKSNCGCISRAISLEAIPRHCRKALRKMALVSPSGIPDEPDLEDHVCIPIHFGWSKEWC